MYRAGMGGGNNRGTEGVQAGYREGTRGLQRGTGRVH